LARQRPRAPGRSHLNGSYLNCSDLNCFDTEDRTPYALRGLFRGAGRTPRGNTTVAAICEICGKTPSFGNNVSHSHRRTPRRWSPNIQRMRTTVRGNTKRIDVCTSCIKAGKVVR
jgi:large subunit ribosomal protein L28